MNLTHGSIQTAFPAVAFQSRGLVIPFAFSHAVNNPAHGFTSRQSSFEFHHQRMYQPAHPETT